MTMPTAQVVLELDASPNTGSYFVLNDPVRGVLNNTTYTLAPGAVAEDVSAYLTGQITLSRGRSREVDAMQAGQISFQLRNETRVFDPTNTASPYYPGIVPRVPVSLMVAGVQVFAGYVADYDAGYAMPAVSVMSVTAQDGFSLLALTDLDAYSAEEESSGDRITAVLQRPEVSYPGPTNIEPGTFVMQASTQDKVKALDHINAVVASEAGTIFVDSAGVLQFKDRNWLSSLLGRYPNGIFTFTDVLPLGRNQIGYTAVAMQSAALLLFNRVTGSRTGGVTQVANDLTSQAKFAIRTLQLQSLENVSDADVLTLCTIYLTRYSEPEVRFSSVSFELNGLDRNAAELLQLDIGSVIAIVRTPPGGGTIQQVGFIEKIDLTLDASNSTALLTFGFGNAVEAGSLFTLDDTERGVLNNPAYVLA